MSDFKWTPKRSEVAILLANGYTQTEIARKMGITDRTIRRWLQHDEFEAEVDRLSLMTDIAGRAMRLRIAKRVARQRIRDDGFVMSKADLLDWLKFAQSETHGIKLDLARLLDELAGLDDAPDEDAG